MNPEAAASISDEVLVAYLDEALDAVERAKVESALRNSGELRQRLAVLQAGSRPFREAFESLLDTVPESLRVRVAEMVENSQPWRRASALGWTIGRRTAIGAVVIGGLGGVLGYWAGRISTSSSTGVDMTNWREAVAQYHRFYSSKTLALASGTGAAADAELSFVSRELGLALSRQSIAVDGLSYKRAQVLRVDSVPLAQIAYVNSGGVPVAYCIRRIEAEDSPPLLERRAGLTVIHWVRNGFGHILVSELDAAEMSRVAAVLSAS